MSRDFWLTVGCVLGVGGILTWEQPVSTVLFAAGALFCLLSAVQE